MAEEQGHKNEVISDADEKLGQIADMIRDAVSKFDSISSRMDSMEERMDARRKDDESFEKWAKEEASEPEHRGDDDNEVEPEGKPAETAADKRRNDAETCGDDDDDRKDDDDDDRKDAEENERMADALEMTRNELAAVRKQISQLQARTPAALSDIDRERFAVIQEQADPAFQAFGDRAPAPLDGETPTQYKRRLGTKLQGNSPKWSKSRLSAVADDAMLDTILADVYADSIAAARRGADVQPGTLREVSRQVGGHIINEFVGEPSSWMGGFVGQVKRAGGNA